MPKIQTANLTPNIDPHSKHQIYNGLDCCLTFEIFEKLYAQLQAKNEPFNQLIYDFERGLQAPALEMMERGWKIDEAQRQEGIKTLTAKVLKLQTILNTLSNVIWGKGLNPASPKQMKEFFYATLRLPEQYKFDKGQKTLTTNREALEKLWVYFYARPFINCILAIREAAKQLSVLTTEVSKKDGRLRTSYNVAGTETGRWSSSASADGSGTNLQNITPVLRRMFIADPGWKIGYLDLEQAESRVVGLLVWLYCGDPTYLDACESGDLHTTVSTLVWSNIQTRAQADEIFYRHFSFRDMAKRGGHGTNYFGTPRTMARHLKVEEKLIKDFQLKYCGDFENWRDSNAPFKGIRKWQFEHVQKSILSTQSMTTLLGRKRVFYGRADDDATLREAIAYEPQSVVGDILNTALWRVWHYEKRVQLLGQVHDAIVFQYPDNPATETEILNRILDLTRIPIHTPNRTLTIPSECKIGWNWGDADAKRYADANPNGLIKYKGQADVRRRLDQ
jgi:DNA polymerase-1